jgi:CheY-like chemotaxis protein/HPt (histidine-containing phosphotransfer) domain-containing protein
MMKILIIEDDQLVANIYRNKFALEGFEAETAPSGEVGLELVHSFRPDAILLDLVLPKLSGLDVLRKIRALPDFEKIPIIVFSNTYLSQMVQDAWKAGATKCLSKSSSTPRIVIDAVNSALKAVAPATPAPKPAPQAATYGIGGNDDEEFQAELRYEFVSSLPSTLASLRTVLQALSRSENEPARMKQIQELYHQTHSLSSNAGIAGAADIALMADALEALLKELQDKPRNINVSTLRTTASAVDFMGVLFDNVSSPDQHNPPAEVLVVDDEAISRRAITFALEKAHMKSLAVEDPVKAVDFLTQKRFDLIFLDVDMPNMSGFELCTKIRTLPQYAKTPVVFVTGLNDLESRANSTMSGGNDFIAKPFLFIELTLKALMLVLRSRLMSARK